LPASPAKSLRKRIARVRKRARRVRKRNRLRASYALERRLASNRRSARSFRRSAPELSGLQQRLVGDLSERGIAIVAYEDLIGDESLWAELSADVAGYARDVEAGLPKGRSTASKKGDYLVRRKVPALAVDDPWIRLATSGEVLGVVNAYRGLWSKLIDFRRIYTVPYPDSAARIASQNWHRDPEDLHVVKLFIYFSDVDADSGPFEYVPGSPRGGRYGGLWPWRPLAKLYPPDELVRQRVPDEDLLSVTGPSGTVIFCDTSGLHRGGFARSKPRIMATYSYVSPASLVAGLESRVLEVEDENAAGRLSPAARFAIS
jgi:Phytanoyl-CoA dioxygenase (PhyH)